MAYKGLRIDVSRGQAGWGSSLSFKKKDFLLKEVILAINLLIQGRMSRFYLWKFWRGEGGVMWLLS